jgi:hypothetical protein
VETVNASGSQEGLHVEGELGVVLEQEPVGGVGVDLDLGLRYQACEEVCAATLPGLLSC